MRIVAIIGLEYYNKHSATSQYETNAVVEREEIAEQMEKGWAPRGLRGVRDLSANITREYLLLGAV